MTFTSPNPSWPICQAAWEFEERVLWPTSDAARKVASVAGRPFQPARQRIDTRIVWPLTDGFKAYSTGARMGIATALAIGALGAGTSAAALTGMFEPGSTPGAQFGSVAAVNVSAVGDGTLHGVAPNFVSHTTEKTESVPKPKGSQKPKNVSEADAVRVAQKFSDAFVRYEVGEAGKGIGDVIGQVATPTLAKALGSRPPRLPAKGKVPRARVLNVLVGKRGGRTIELSVSIARLKAISEVRLTLTQTQDRWLVSEVLA